MADVKWALDSISPQWINDVFRCVLMCLFTMVYCSIMYHVIIVKLWVLLWYSMVLLWHTIILPLYSCSGIIAIYMCRCSCIWEDTNLFISFFTQTKVCKCKYTSAACSSFCYLFYVDLYMYCGTMDPCTLVKYSFTYNSMHKLCIMYSNINNSIKLCLHYTYPIDLPSALLHVLFTYIIIDPYHYMILFTINGSGSVYIKMHIGSWHLQLKIIFRFSLSAISTCQNNSVSNKCFIQLASLGVRYILDVHRP